MIERLNSALIDRYAIQRELGEGGMATVFLAEDLRHRRKVAVKVLKPELAAVVGAERFLSEIETTARLQHPNILPLFDSGEADSFLFYVMPLVEGESLRDRLEREKQLPVDEAVRIAVEVAEALQSAHQHGVIHRDVKPANILLSQGRPLVADFGIALAVSAAGGHRLTETGLSLGTPHYMSPEQATGDRVVGPASDVYSLGCVLYEMLVGEPPYTGSTAQAILGKVITSDPESITAQRRSVPAHVDAVVAKALEKLPADRFASAADFAKALGDEGFRHGAAKGPLGTTGRKFGSFAGWAVAAVLALLWLPSTLDIETPPAVRRVSLAIPDGASPNEYLSLTPDGSALILANHSGGGLFAQRLDDLARTAIPGSEDGRETSVSPDGESVAFGTSRGLKVASLVGGAARTLIPDGSICCARWDPDGNIYYTVIDEGSVYRVASGGGEPELVLPVDSAGRVLSYYDPLPGGGRAIVAASGIPSNVEIVDTRTGRRQALVDGTRPFVTETGHLLFARPGGGLYAAPLDADAMELTGSPVLMLEGVGILAGGVDAMYTLSKEGHLAYWAPPAVESQDVNDLIWVSRRGEASPVDTTWTESFESVELSPDGTRAAVTVGEFRDTEIWVKELDDGFARRLTNYRGMNRRPVWSPDGTTLAFISDRDGRRAVYSVSVDGIATPQLLFSHPGEDVDEVAWSPDGDWLVYRIGTDPNRRDIYARRLRPDTMTLVVSAQPEIDERSPVLSPDGRWLAYVSNETGQEEVWVRPFPDVARGSRQISRNRGVEPLWSPRGDELFFRSSSGFTSVAVRSEGDFSSAAPQAHFPNGVSVINITFRTYAYDRERDRFLMIRNRGQESAPAELILIQNFIEEVKARVGG